MALVALFAVMVEVCATLGLFAALSHSVQRPTVPNQKPGVHEAVQWNIKLGRLQMGWYREPLVNFAVPKPSLEDFDSY